MAGANNKALKKAGMTAREVETFRATGGKSLRATVTAAKHSPTVQGANADFRAKAAAGLKSVAERKAALQAARQQRVGKSLGAAMQVARGMRQKQAASASALPKLSGSDKQAAWASKMRDAAISAAERAAKQAPGLWADTVRVFRSVKSARTWIDYGRSPTDHVYNVRHMAGAEGIRLD